MGRRPGTSPWLQKEKKEKKRGIKSCSPLRVVDWEPTHRLVGGISRVGRRRKVTTMRRGKMEEKRVVQGGWV